MAFPRKQIYAALSILSALAVFLFFGLKYPYHLHYQEQYQLFQFTWTYFLDLVTVPGGLADWCGRFLVQFCYYYWAGAAILAFLFATLQLLTHFAFRQAPYSLSFVPAVLVFLFLLDENALFSAPVAIVGSLAALLLTRKSGSFVVAVVQFVLFFLLGPLSLAYGLCIAVFKKKIWIAIASVILFAAWTVVSYLIFPYSFDNLLFGLHYHRFRSVVPVLPIVAALCIPLVGMSEICRPRIRKQSWKAVANVLLFAIIVSVSVFHTSKMADMSKEETMKYDFFARMKMWNRIIELADKKSPSTPIPVACLNLALAMTDRMGDRMFNYFQNGPQGLLADFVRDYTSPLSTAEAYYHLGMINTAQRFVFEAQEAIPDYQKSARCYARLAETNLINGYYDVARKYLIPLTHTLFYRKWAESVIALLEDEDAIESHPEYGRLRRYRFTRRDFLFSNDEKYSMLGLLSSDNHENYVAYNYLLGLTLLSKDLQHFVECLSLVNYETMPKVYQEALLLYWVQTHEGLDGLPSVINPNLVDRMIGYMRDSKAGKNMKYLEKVYGNTYWFYYLNRYR